MNQAIWANLFWKEWCEHRWKLAALTAISFGAFGAFLLSDRQEVVTTSLWFALVSYTPLASLFIAMGLSASEQARGTIVTLQTLPSAMWRAALAKLAVGVLTIVSPAVLLAIIAALIDRFRSGANHSSLPFTHAYGFSGAEWMLVMPVMAGLAGASLLVWILAISANRPTELRAGVRALLVVVALWTVVGTVASWYSQTFLTPDLPQESFTIAQRSLGVLAAGAPGGAVFAFLLKGETPWLRVALAWYGVVHGLLVWRWLACYGLASGRAPTVSQASATLVSGWLGPPRSSPTLAILWKQVRECLPITGGLVAIVAGFATCLIVAEDGAPNYPIERVWVVVWVTMMSGFLAALVVGVAGFQDDLSSGISVFWRSRPISPDSWFWLKYGGGALTLAIVFGGMYLGSWLIDARESAQNSEYALQTVLAFWTVYSSAVCVACLVRNAVYAGILSFAVAAYTTWVTFARWGDDYLPVAFQVVILTVMSIGLTLLAWQAMRRDWALRLT